MGIEFWEAVATLVGAIIGAGIFGIPYVVAEAGFLTGAFVIFILGFVVLMLYLYVGEVILRTKGKHQLTGYAEKYLGRWGKRAMLFSMVFGLYGALIAYLIGEGKALSVMLSPVIGGTQMIYMLVFFCITAFLLHCGLDALEKSELITMGAILFIVLLITVFTFPNVKSSNLAGFHITRFFIPFGVVLFAYLGMVAVPEASEIIGKNRKELKKVLIISMIIPMAVYFLFTLVVVGSISLAQFELLGLNDRIATIALGQVLGDNMFIIANVFTVFAMFTSFLAIGYALKEMFMYDYKISKNKAWLLTCVIPLAIAVYILYTKSIGFIGVLNISGVVAGGISALIILLMFHAAKRKGVREPEYSIRPNVFLSVFIGALFILGAIFLIL